MEKRKFSRSELKYDLLSEIVKRNFSNYKIRSESFDDGNNGNFEGILIKRSVMISCWVFYMPKDDNEDKIIIISPGVIESSFLHFLFFITYVITGGITLLFGYIVYRNFQANFRDKIVEILKQYIEKPEVIKNGKQKGIVLN